MLTQGMPVISGGRNANVELGDVFILWNDHPTREVREAARAGTAVYYKFQEPSTKNQISDKQQTTKKGKGKGKGKGKTKTNPAAPAERSDPPAGGEAGAPDSVNFPAYVMLCPEARHDGELRERSRAALREYFRAGASKSEVIRTEAVQWSRKLGVGGDTSFGVAVPARTKAEQAEEAERQRALKAREEEEQHLAAGVNEDEPAEAAPAGKAKAAGRGSHRFDAETEAALSRELASGGIERLTDGAGEE